VTDFRFAEPHWIHLVWLVVLFVGLLVWFETRGNTSLDRLVSPLMQKRLVLRPSRGRRLSAIALSGISALSLVAALMRPQWGFHYEPTVRVGAQLMIALDVSRSMLAEDVAPNRLDRAKAEVQDLLSYLGRDHVGLIAFAGRATVLCPLTPDFGFFRLVLESAGPASVTRGGTNLEEPIRKALAGFQGQSDLSRVIVMITDGEDHDSFALEAAREAAERGIRIVTIGLGDESGSRVFLTDPRTGARNVLLDGSGKPVVTRMDGGLLRKIALESGGVYIPASTGALDLRSIYQSHIAPLTRGRLEDRSRLMRREGFQWAMLLALSTLIAAMVTAGGGRALGESAGGFTGVIRAALLVLFVLLSSLSARAQEPPPKARAPVHTSKADGEGMEDKDARELYNDGSAQLQAGRWDDARRRFELARSKAGTDGPARFRATYNLGWLEAKSADDLLQSDPKKALEHLKAASDWFREAVRLAPGEQAARENLELVIRRILRLADALEKRDDDGLAKHLDELIEKQRDMARLLQGTVERAASLVGPSLPEHMRNEFRSLKVEQGKILSRLEELTGTLREKADALGALKEEERSAEQNMRRLQIESVLAYLHRAGGRVGQARRQLREYQAERAYRRASAGLGDMQRARDQLRSLVQVLRMVIDDAMLLTRQTGDLAGDATAAPGASSGSEPRPAWLTVEYVQDLLENVQDRTKELVLRVEAGVKAKDEPPAPDPGQEKSVSKGQERRRKSLLLALGEAQPLMEKARDAFGEAGQALASNLLPKAYEAEARGTTLLLKTRELFLDIRSLIEVIYGDEKFMKTLFGRDDPGRAAGLEENLPLLGQVQSTNIDRGKRLDGMLDQELEGGDPGKGNSTGAPAGGAPGKSTGEDPDLHRQQIQLAKNLLARAMGSFTGIERSLNGWKGKAPNKTDVKKVESGVDESLKHLEALRRLFFSILEHLKETALNQARLADDTRDVATLTEETEIQKGVGPLLPRQRELAAVAKEIAGSLKKQSEQSPNKITARQAKGKPEDRASQDAAHRLAGAAEHVSRAGQAMDGAIHKMAGNPKGLKAVQEDQAAAIQNLAEAIQLLSPPPGDPKKESGEQNQQAEPQAAKAAKARKEEQAESTDMRQLLQSVRDREAERRREKRQRSTAGYAPVEKDW